MRQLIPPNHNWHIAPGVLTPVLANTRSFSTQGDVTGWYTTGRSPAFVPHVAQGSSPGWWAMQSSLDHHLRKVNPWLKRLSMLVSQSPAVLLAGSLLVPSVWAQDPSGPVISRQSCVQPVASLSGPQNAALKSNKKASKYDVNQIGHRGVGEGANDYSLEEERQLGRELSEEIEMTATLIADPVLTAYVDQLGQTIVHHSDAQMPFTLKVVESDEISALALPGGYLYVNSGLILAADSEAELAGLMAHEIAHVAARHATRAETRIRLFAALSMALMFFGGPAALQVGVGIAGPAASMRFGRDAEREADLLGLEYEYAAGYDPQALVQFFEKLHVAEKHKNNFLARAFASHSMTADRVRRAQEEISTLLPAKTAYIVDTSEFQEVKSRLAGIMREHAPSENGRPILHRRTRADDQALSSSP